MPQEAEKPQPVKEATDNVSERPKSQMDKEIAEKQKEKLAKESIEREYEESIISLKGASSSEALAWVFQKFDQVITSTKNA